MSDQPAPALGYPFEWRPRAEHVNARSHFIAEMNVQTEMSKDDWHTLIKKYDAEDPGYFVEWWQLRRSGTG